MIAAPVIAVGITTSITPLQRAFQTLDTSRHLNLAAQVMQSEFEQLQALQDVNGTKLLYTMVARAEGDSFSCRRSIRDLRPEMKENTLHRAPSGVIPARGGSPAVPLVEVVIATTCQVWHRQAR